MLGVSGKGDLLTPERGVGYSLGWLVKEALPKRDTFSQTLKG